MSDRSYENKPSLLKSKRYKSFIDDRDKTLESILAKYKDAQDLVVLKLKSLVIDTTVAHRMLSTQDMNSVKNLERKIDSLFDIAANASYELLLRMRKSVYVLSYAGEAEAMGQALQRVMKVSLGKFDIHQAISKPHAMNKLSLKNTIDRSFNNLKRKVTASLELGLLLGESHEELTERVNSVFPKLIKVTKPRRQLRSIVREADFKTYKTGNKTEFSAGIVDSQDWEDMLEDAQSDETPTTAFTRSEATTVKDGEELQEWELENKINDDFVNQVRDGQLDAANDNGITDMLWIAVSHKTLCDHCEWRDGLTSTEIEEQLEDKEEDLEHFDKIVPPLHPYCYCKMVPTTDEIQQISQDLDDQYAKDFAEWLDTSQS